MFEAQILFGAADAGAAVYSPWFPRQGDNAVFTLDTIEIQGTGAQLSVQVFTKNSEDAGDGAVADDGMGSAVEIVRTLADGPGRENNTWEGNLKEMVRYKFIMKNSTDDWALFRMLPPVWFDSVAP